MPIKKIKRKLSAKKQSSLKSVALEEKQALWELSDSEIKARIKRINKDFSKAFKLLRNHTDTITFFGSARFDESNEYYQSARELSRRITSELGLTVVTGGGPGIMEAANRGAHEYLNGKGNKNKGIKSIGMTIELPQEQVTNKYVNYSADFYYFFSRKVALAYSARAYVYFPGGFGTLDEFFEILTLKQTFKIPNIPIILCGKEFWQPLLEYIDQTVYQHANAISKNEMKLYVLTDDHDEILDIIANSNRENY